MLADMKHELGVMEQELDEKGNMRCVNCGYFLERDYYSEYDSGDDWNVYGAEELEELAVMQQELDEREDMMVLDGSEEEEAEEVILEEKYRCEKKECGMFHIGNLYISEFVEP